MIAVPQLKWPARKGAKITVAFGVRGSNWSAGIHKGVDIDDEMGAPVYAAHPGICSHAGEAPPGKPSNMAWGRYVVLEHAWHGLQFRTYYNHLSGICCAVGQEIDSGQEVGKMGNTGNVRPGPGSDGSHLCFGLFVKRDDGWHWEEPRFFNEIV